MQLKFEAKNVSNDKVDTRLGVEVKVQDVNDHAPVFKPLNYEKSINESEPQGGVTICTQCPCVVLAIRLQYNEVSHFFAKSFLEEILSNT